MTIGALLGKTPLPAPQPAPTPRPQPPPPPPAATKGKPTARPKGPVVEIWISKEGRAGKAVSLLKSSLAAPEAEALLGALKRALAVGGSYKNGEILIQSADRSRVAAALEKLGHQAKICGG